MEENKKKGRVLISFNGVIYKNSYDTIFENIDFNLYEGDFTVILARNGEGLSSFLKIASGLYNISSGSVIMRGHEINDKNKKNIMKLKSNNGFYFEDNALISRYTIYDNLALHPNYNTNMITEDIDRMIEGWIKKFGMSMSEIKKMYPSDINSRNRKYINLIRAIMHKPVILFLDSMFDTSDTNTNTILKENIKEFFLNNNSTILASSNKIEYYKELATRILILKNKEIYFDGGYEEYMKHQETDDFFRIFM